MGVVGRAAGIADYHGYFIPELWAPKMLWGFEKRTVLEAIASTEYEGMIKKQGDTVHINIEPTVTINDYVKGQKLVRESLTPSKVTLEIDTAKSYSIHVDDIDEAQANLSLIDTFAESAGKRLKEKIDYTVLHAIYNDEATYNSGATAGYDSRAFNLGVSTIPLALTENNILDKLADIATVLDERDVPEEGRSIVLPPVFCNLLLKSDLKDASFSGTGPTITLNGKLPKQLAGFDVYRSRQLYSVADGTSPYPTCFYCIALHKSALTFASQLVETRAVVANDTFGNYIDGLHVFGYKVVRSEALAIMYAYYAG